jgi:catechol 2,3-dioxygenase-like lactoylglutathione lyase family enzyme
MAITFHSTVIITNDFKKMKSFYKEILQQKTTFDFGNCIGFNNGLSLWKLKDAYPITKKLGQTFNKNGNNNIEICFETDEFESVVVNLEKHQLTYLHGVTEELWGQKTIRFYDPENNLVEIGETIPCFVKRLHKQGMSIDEVARQTSVPADLVSQICKTNNSLNN